MTLVLTHWQLTAGSLPEELLPDCSAPAFSLPGAGALDEYAELLGLSESDSSKDAPAEPVSAPFALPAMIPQGVCGSIALSREIDFGALSGDHAFLTLDHVIGRGEIRLNDTPVARFGDSAAQDMAAAYAMTGVPCMLCADLTDALLLGKKQTLTLQFDDDTPCGVPGPVFLHTTAHARLSHVRIAPDAARRTMTLRTRVHSEAGGTYCLRVLPIAAEPGASAQAVRELSLDCKPGEDHEALLSLALDAPAFTPGKPYAAPALKIQLLRKGKRAGMLCDETLLMCGYPGRAPQAYLPLTQKDCTGDPEALLDLLRRLNLFCVRFPAVPADRVMRTLCRAGVCVLLPEDDPLRAACQRYPHAASGGTNSAPISPEAAAWQLCGSIAFPRQPDAALTVQDMLLDICGKAADPQDDGIRNVLSWLRAVQIRLRAEAARQNRYEGALCAPGEALIPDIADALRTAFAPVHLSALPLCGAWWTGTRFSATLESFFEEGSEPVTARCVLEDEDGAVLARTETVQKKPGYAGVIEAALPDHPCVLSLSCTLLRAGEVIEQNSIPVYVGERGPLEAAFM